MPGFGGQNAIRENIKLVRAFADSGGFLAVLTVLEHQTELEGPVCLK